MADIEDDVAGVKKPKLKIKLKQPNKAKPHVKLKRMDLPQPKPKAVKEPEKPKLKRVAPIKSKKAKEAEKAAKAKPEAAPKETKAKTAKDTKPKRTAKDTKPLRSAKDTKPVKTAKAAAAKTAKPKLTKAAPKKPKSASTAAAPEEKNAIEKKVRIATRQGRLKKRADSSLRWYLSKLREAGGSHDERNVATAVSSRQKMYIGGMYQYVYDAKTKETLPYWDAFPLIVCINVYADGWLGLNLHYLPPILRAKLLDKLMEYSKTIRTGGNGRRTYMHLSYKMLTRLSQVPFFQHCIKRYLASHVQSKIMRVNSSFWEEVAFLPTQQFKKAPDSTVWKDARRYK